MTSKKKLVAIPTPKNIILCSDGTGNRGGKANGTNVWRLYKALDLHNTTRQQVAIHDDGVGTQDSTLFKALGGAFGLGLTANIKRLYKFLVIQYDPGDEIFFFGFSRGAHTVRIVAGMVCRVGLVDRNQCKTERDLDAAINDAYDAYVTALKQQKRRLPAHGGSPTLLAQSLTPPEIGAVETPDIVTFIARKDVLNDVRVKFIGVWDTVDAVGVPVDELREGLDLFSRVAILDTSLHAKVEHACHALAIDDQRHTFHPVMWDEWKKAGSQTIEQVWFAGVHANVGGGYEKDEMALVSLNWMMAHAVQHGVLFDEPTWESYLRDADVHSKLYDSRAGLCAYYRYLPRDIKKISLKHGIAVTKIHASVFDRIQHATDGYAPFNLPDDMEMVMEPGRATRGFDAAVMQTYSAEGCLDPKRVGYLGKTWDLVWYKRRLYFSLVATTLALLGVIFWLGKQPAAACIGEWCVVGWIFTALGAVLPDVVENGLAALRTNPFWLFLFGAVFGALWRLRFLVDRRIREVSNAGWRRVFPERRPQANVEFGGLETTLLALARRFRNSWWGTRAVPWIQTNVMPRLALYGTVAVAIWLLFAACSVTTVHVAPSPCVAARSCAPAVNDMLFQTDAPCFATGIMLEAGKTYRIGVVPETPWKDKNISTGPAGFPSRAGPPWLVAMVPFRRVWTEPWFTLMGSTGCDGEDLFTIGNGLERYTATRSGPLHLFVNDALCPVCPGGVWYFYKNNQGTARVSVTEVD